MQNGLSEKADGLCARLSDANSGLSGERIRRADSSGGECALCFADARGFMAHRAGSYTGCVQYFEPLNACFVETHTCVVEDGETGRMSQRQMRRADAAVGTCHDDLTAHFVGEIGRAHV